MKFKCESCSAQYAIADDKVGKKGVRVRCKKCGNIITVRPQTDDSAQKGNSPTDESEKASAANTASDSPEMALRASEPPADLSEPSEPSGPTDESMDGLSTRVAPSPLGDAPQKSGFEVGEEDLGNAFSNLLGQDGLSDKNTDDNPDEFDHQMTRVFSAEDMQRVQEEKAQLDQAAPAAEKSEASPSIQPEGLGSQDKVSSPARTDLDQDKLEWYLALDDQQIGPVSLADVATRWERNELDPETLVWKSGFEDWLPLFEIPDFKFLIESREKRLPDLEPSLGDGSISGGISGTGTQSHEPAQHADANRAEYDGDERPAEASAAFASDVDWKPSAISALGSLAQEELIGLRPPEPEPAPSEITEGSNFSFSDKAPMDVEQPQLAQAEEGGSSIIAQIAAEEEAANRAAEQKRQEEDRLALDAKKKEEEDLAAQEAARREQYQEQLQKVSIPPAEQMMSPRAGMPGWAVGVMISLGVAIIGLACVVTYMVATSGKTETQSVAPQTPLSAPGTPASGGQIPQANPAQPTAGSEAPAAKISNEASNSSPPTADGGSPPQPPEPAPGAAGSSGTAVTKGQAASPPGELPGTAATAPKKANVTKPPKPLVATNRTTGAKEPLEPKPPEEKIKADPPSKPKGGGLLDFDGAEEAGKATAVKEPPPAEAKKELPPLSQADVMEVMREHVPEFQACTRKQKEADASVTGRMVITFTVKQDGSVTGAANSTPEFNNTIVSACIIKAIQHIKFPKNGGPPKTVPFPFTVK